jgi:hypothetical protein
VDRYGTGPYEDLSNLIIENNHLYLNWQDMPNLSEFDKDNRGVANLNSLMDYIDLNIDNSKIYIHCDYGQSRSPAIAMLYLSKRTKKLPSDFESAKIKFGIEYPDYFSNTGITKYIGVNWEELL